MCACGTDSGCGGGGGVLRETVCGVGGDGVGGGGMAARLWGVS